MGLQSQILRFQEGKAKSIEGQAQNDVKQYILYVRKTWFAEFHFHPLGGENQGGFSEFRTPNFELS